MLIYGVIAQLWWNSSTSFCLSSKNLFFCKSEWLITRKIIWWGELSCEGSGSNPGCGKKIDFFPSVLALGDCDICGLHDCKKKFNIVGWVRLRFKSRVVKRLIFSYLFKLWGTITCGCHVCKMKFNVVGWVARSQVQIPGVVKRLIFSCLFELWGSGLPVDAMIV